MSDAYKQIKTLLEHAPSADCPDPVEAANYLRDAADEVERGKIVRFAMIAQDRNGDIIIFRRARNRLVYIGMLEHAKTQGSND